MMTNAQVHQYLKGLGYPIESVSFDRDAPVLEEIHEEVIDDETKEVVRDEKGEPLTRKVVRPVLDERKEPVTEERWVLSFSGDTTDEDRANAYAALEALDKTEAPASPEEDRSARELASDPKVSNDAFVTAFRAAYAAGNLK